jgi:DNA-binding NarL/FixJ family response regulator
MKTIVQMLIVDDHAIVREGLHTLLLEEVTIQVVGEARNGVEALALAEQLQPDVVLMDLVMPEMDGITATRKIRQSCPNTQVLVLTSFAEDQRVPEAIQAGAIG